MRRRIALVGLLFYAVLAVGSLGGWWAHPDARAATFARRGGGAALGPAECIADPAGGLTLTGVAAVLLPFGLRVRPGRHVAIFAGWLALSLVEAVQKDFLPVPPPPHGNGGVHAGWCTALTHLADGPVLGGAHAATVALHRVLGTPVAPSRSSLRYSFPSGHSARLLYVLGIAAAGYLGGGVWGWAAAVAAALAEGLVLVAAGWHWAVDVLAGWTLAAIALAVVLPIRPRRRRGSGPAVSRRLVRRN